MGLWKLGDRLFSPDDAKLDVSKSGAAEAPFPAIAAHCLLLQTRPTRRCKCKGLSSGACGCGFGPKRIGQHKVRDAGKEDGLRDQTDLSLPLTSCVFWALAPSFVK